MRARFLLALALLAAPACGGGGSGVDSGTGGGLDTGSGGGGGVSGQRLDGTPISFAEVLRVGGGPTEAVNLRFHSEALGCGWSTSTCTDASRVLRVTVMRYPPGSGALTPGTYSVGDSGIVFEAYFEQPTGAMCGGGTATEMMLDAPSSITFTSIGDTEVVGSLSLTMRERSGPRTYTFTGSFTAPDCT